jgi:hypothetical protein
MLKLLGLFTGGYGPLILIGALILATNSGTAYITHRVDSATLQSWKTAQAQQAAKDAAEALAQLQAHNEAANKAVAAAQQDAKRRALENQSLRNKISHAPKTRACVDSPAIRALVDGLRSGANDSH